MQQGNSNEDPFKLPKRSLSVAFAAGSILFFLFIAFVGFSATQLRFSVGEAFYTVKGENFVLSIPINVSNNGLFDLQNLQINTTVSEGGIELFNFTTIVPKITHQSETTFTHNLTVNLPSFLANHQTFLFNDSQLQATERVHLVLAALIPVGLDFNSTYDWGAPLNDFSTSNLQFQPVNSTTILASLDIAFNNHANFPLEGNLTITAFGGTTQVATQSLQLSVKSKDSFKSTIQFWLPTTALVSRVALMIQTDSFSWEENVYAHV